MNRFQQMFLLVLTVGVVACGPDSNSYTPTVDTVSRTAEIEINGATRHISIVSQGESIPSRTIDACVIGFDTKDLAYSEESADELVLGSQTLEYVRPLVRPESAAGVDGRLFAVWKMPSYTTQQVTYSIEVEIHPDHMIYRNTCTI